MAVSCHRPVLLQGPVGSGKTSTVEYLAYITGRKGLNHGNADGQDDSSNKFLKVQLGEQTDSRMLIGGYQCTEIPGQFVWKPGVLTQVSLIYNFFELTLIHKSNNEFFIRQFFKGIGYCLKILTALVQM